MLAACGIQVDPRHERAVDLQRSRPGRRADGTATSTRCRSRRSRSGVRHGAGPTGSPGRDRGPSSPRTRSPRRRYGPDRSRRPGSDTGSRSARSGCQNCRGDRLKPISRSMPRSSHAPSLVDELVHDPVADRLDQSELLGERDEVPGRDHRSVGLDPADQRLHARHLSRSRARSRVGSAGPNADPSTALRSRVTICSLAAESIDAPRGDDVAGRTGLLALIHRGLSVALQTARRPRRPAGRG